MSDDVIVFDGANVDSRWITTVVFAVVTIWSTESSTVIRVNLELKIEAVGMKFPPSFGNFGPNKTFIYLRKDIWVDMMPFRNQFDHQLN